LLSRYSSLADSDHGVFFLCLSVSTGQTPWPSHSLMSQFSRLNPPQILRCTYVSYLVSNLSRWKQRLSSDDVSNACACMPQFMFMSFVKRKREVIKMSSTVLRLTYSCASIVRRRIDFQAYFFVCLRILSDLFIQWLGHEPLVTPNYSSSLCLITMFQLRPAYTDFIVQGVCNETP
jgi:hypothetical protein